MYDVTIVGCSVSGAVLASLLGHRYRVLVLERRAKGASAKCCGGLISSAGQKSLAMLGLALPVDILTGPQPFAVHCTDFFTGQQRYYQKKYFNIDRAGFEQWLISLIPDRVTIVRGGRYKRHHVHARGGVSVEYLEDNRTKFVETRILVGADGANSRVRRNLGGGHSGRRYIAIQHEFKRLQSINYYGVFFDKRVTDFYGWLIPKGGSLLVGAALPESRQAGCNFDKLLGNVQGLGYDLSRFVRKEGCYILNPVSNKDISCGGGAVALTGEAGGFISPSSAEGYSYAIKTAVALYRSLEHDIDNWSQRYKQNLQFIRSDLALKRLKAKVIFSSTLRNFIFRAGIGSLKIDNRYLV